MGPKNLITPKKTGSPDFILLLVTMALLALGIVMVFSSSVGYLVGFEGNDNIYKYVTAQSLWAGLGLVAMFLLTHVDHHNYRKIAPLLLLAGIITLIMIHIPGLGETRRGSTRWLSLGFMTFQPSEPIKLVLSIFFAAFLAQHKFKTLKDTLLPVAIFGACALLVFKQPDLGTTMVIAATVMGMFFAANMPWRHLLSLLGLGGAAVVYGVLSTPYMLERINIWLNPWADPLNKGYQTVNALLALGSGGVLGTGLGRGMQKFGHVPENYTDMIFAIIGEELGLIGTAAVIILFALFVWRGLSVATKVKNPFSRYLAVGITCMVGFQALMNLGVVTDLLPVTGVTLPFISYGGSSLTLNLAGVGVLLNISRYARRDEKTETS